MRQRSLPVCAGMALLVFVSGMAGAFTLDSKTASAGLKEALETGTGRAVDLLGRADGYFGNPDVRIPVPGELETVAKGLGKLGMGDIVGEFETSINRAAEAAAPLAREVFVTSIREMTIEDAVAIARGNGHEATDYLREHAGPLLASRFLPIVSGQLEQVGATRAFSGMMDRTSAIPFLKEPVFELDAYVTDRALDGMFLMIAREEERIRTDPIARTTDLLRKVFGSGQDSAEKPWWKRLLGGD